MTHWSCTKKRIKQGHLRLSRRKWSMARKHTIFIDALFHTAIAGLHSAQRSAPPFQHILEQLSCACSRSQALAALPWHRGGWGSKALQAMAQSAAHSLVGTICFLACLFVSLLSLLKIEIKDWKTFWPRIWKTDTEARRKLLHICFSYKEPFWALGWQGRKKKVHTGEENYLLDLLCNSYLLYLKIISMHTTPKSYITSWVSGCKH